jgi:DedD protein
MLATEQESPLKKRLLGAMVLIILAMILIPPLMEDSAIPTIVILPMPTPPPIKTVSVSQPADSSVQTSLTTANSKNISKSQASLPTWIIQVASFTDSKNAQRLIKQLRAAKLQTPAAKEIQIKGKTHYRVRVGPFLDQAEAQSVLHQIQALSEVEPQVVPYP